MKLRFNIQDIPEGESHRCVELNEQDVDLGSHTFRGGRVNLDFNRTLYFIQVDFTIQAIVELTCDRSLDRFDYVIDTDFEVVFKVGIEQAVVGEDSIIKPFDFDSQEMDLEEDVRDTILLEVPAKKIHPRFIDDAGNIQDFETQTYGESAEEEMNDPRWEALKKLKK